MSSFVVHLIIPVLVVLSTGLFRLRDVWVWSWPAWAGDIDYLGWIFHVKWDWPNFHRALFHNVWWLVLAVALAVRAWRRWRRSHDEDVVGFARARPAWLLVPFMYATHLILDVFQGGIVAFWPLSFRTFFWDFEITVDTSKPLPVPQVSSESGTYVGVPDVSHVYAWLNAEQFAIFVLYATSVILTLMLWSTRTRPWAALESWGFSPREDAAKPAAALRQASASARWRRPRARRARTGR